MKEELYCPFGDGGVCVENCKLYDKRYRNCMLQIADSTLNMGHFNGADDEDWSPNVNRCWYEVETNTLYVDDADVLDSYFSLMAFNVGTIPPLLERIAKALEKIAGIEK